MVEHRHLLLLELLAQIALQAVATSTAMSDKPGQSGAIRGRHLLVIKGHQRSSKVHPRSSEVIRFHPRSSEVIRGHPRSSEAIRGRQLESSLTLMYASPLPRPTSSRSLSSTRNPLLADACAMPAPIRPAPRMPIVSTDTAGLPYLFFLHSVWTQERPRSAISRHQSPSDVIRRHQTPRTPSEAIRGHQRPIRGHSGPIRGQSEAISPGHRRGQSEANQSQSEPIRGHQRLSHLAIEEANQRPSEANQRPIRANQSQSEVIRGYLTWP